MINLKHTDPSQELVKDLIQTTEGKKEIASSSIKSTSSRIPASAIVDEQASSRKIVRDLWPFSRSYYNRNRRDRRDKDYRAEWYPEETDISLGKSEKELSSEETTSATTSTSSPSSLSSSYSDIQDLIGAGSDAFTNIYDIEYHISSQDQQDWSVGNVFKWRSGDITLPEEKVGTQKISFNTGSFDTIVPTAFTNKTVSIPISIDANYLVCKKLQALLHRRSQHAGYFNNELDSEKGEGDDTLTVSLESSALGPRSYYKSDSPILTYTFHHVDLIDLSSFRYSREGSSPVKITATFKYVYFEVSPSLSKISENIAGTI